MQYVLNAYEFYNFFSPLNTCNGVLITYASQKFNINSQNTFLITKVIKLNIKLMIEIKSVFEWCVKGINKNEMMVSCDVTHEVISLFMYY